MKTGKIYRCGNCEIKCDDTYAISMQSHKCGQVQDVAVFYGCSLECTKYIQREEVKMGYIKLITKNTKKIEQFTKLMALSVKDEITLDGLFECIKYLKTENKAMKLLISQEATSAEIIVAFNTYRDCTLTLSEIIQDDKITKATGLKKEIYEGTYPNYLHLCGMMRFATEMMIYSHHDTWCVD